MNAAVRQESVSDGIRGSTHIEAIDEQIDGVHVDLWIREVDVVASLEAQSEGRRRDEYTRTAIRIGVLALQQAQGRIDANLVRDEGERLVASLESKLENYQKEMGTLLTATLGNYFDPSSGRFNERVDRLVRKDGELERILRNESDAFANALRATIEAQVGGESPLMELLRPGDANALIGSIRSCVDQTLAAQQSRVLQEFSLDNTDGALSRLVRELFASNSRLLEDVKANAATVVGEFSLDKEDSALSRLVRRVEEAQRSISAEFTLDEERSALSRMRRELLGMMASQQQDNAKFQQTVVAELEAMKAKRKESLRSTRHGAEFEAEAFATVSRYCQSAADITEQVGNTTGVIKNCKVGDCVITLGPDCDASGARIVCEMKEDASYDVGRSLKEIDLARRNRGADVGMMILSSSTAPDGLSRMTRYGQDIVVVWNAEDEASDVYLFAGLMVAKALAMRATIVDDELDADFDAIERSIRDVEKQIVSLHDIRKHSNTIKSGAEKILERTELMQSALEKQVRTLDEQMKLVREHLGSAAGGEHVA